MTEIILFVAGALVGWLITHIYDRRGSREQQALHDKLTSDARRWIMEASASPLTVADLNRLLEERTIDFSSPDDPLPFKACPRCGDTDLERSSAEHPSRDDIYFFINCRACGWSEWTE